jgi:hypothetical protein
MKKILPALAIFSFLVCTLQAENSHVFPPVGVVTPEFTQSPSTLSTVNNITGAETLLPRTAESVAPRQAPPIALVVLFLCLILIATLFIRTPVENSKSH